MEPARYAADRDPTEAFGDVRDEATGKCDASTLPRSRQVVFSDSSHPGDDSDHSVLGKAAEYRFELRSFFELL